MNSGDDNKNCKNSRASNNNVSTNNNTSIGSTKGIDVSSNINSSTPLLSAASGNVKDYSTNASNDLSENLENYIQENEDNMKSERPNVENLDDGSLKKLLEEAYSYKRPADKENKSAIFLQLLQKAEKEEDNFDRRRRSDRTSSSSLQDLFEASQIDYDYSYNLKHRRNHNSRHKKNSSVSSRQREGGSLPSNVNVSNCNLSIYDRSFLNDIIGDTFQKNDRPSLASMSQFGFDTINSNSSICKEFETKNYSGGNNSGVGTSAAGGIGANIPSCTSNANDAIIDIGDNVPEQQFFLSKDSTVQGLSEPMDIDDYDEIKKHPRIINSNQIFNNKVESSSSTAKSFVDDGIRFSTFENNKISVDANSCISLDEKYPSCKSLLGEKSDLTKQQPLYTTTKNIPKQLDENGNALGAHILSSMPSSSSSTNQSQSKVKKKKLHSERNTTTINVQNLEGFRGYDPINDLVKYIENDEKGEPSTSSNNKKFEKSSKLNENKNKREKGKKDKEHRDVQQKLKKSNSLEELRSCSKLDEEMKTDNTTVQLRNKNKATKSGSNNNNGGHSITNIINSNSTTASDQSNSKDINNSNNINKHKRGERRSWGTEELTYLGENNAIEEVREKTKEKEKKKNKDINHFVSNPIYAEPSIAFKETINATSSFLENNQPKNKKSSKEHNSDNTTLELQTTTNDLISKDDTLFTVPSCPTAETSISITPGNNLGSLDILQCENAGFHVVTKKKKSKKRQAADENNQNNSNNQNHNRNHFQSTFGSNNKFSNRDQQQYSKNHNNKYNNSTTSVSNFHNVRDTYARNKKDKSRRKSASSVPPSEKSDSSDCESVHSLPIESTTTNNSSNRINFNNQNTAACRTSASSTGTVPQNNQSPNVNNNSSNSSSTTKSYADMARFSTSVAVSNSGNVSTATAAWPAVSSGSNSSSASETTNTTKSNKKNLNKTDFPELNHQLEAAAQNNNNNNINNNNNNNNNNNKQIQQNNKEDPISATKSKQSNSNNTAINTKSKNLEKSLANQSNTEHITISNTKQTLQKSKSVESEAYINSIEQYPALGKIAKRQTAISLTNSSSTNSILQQQQAIVIPQQFQPSTSKQTVATVDDEKTVTPITCVPATPASITPIATVTPIINSTANLIPKQQNIAVQTPTVVLNNTGVTTNIAFALQPQKQPQQSHVIFMHPASQLPLSSLTSNPLLNTDKAEVLVVVNNNTNNLIYSTTSNDSISHHNFNLLNTTSIKNSNNLALNTQNQESTISNDFIGSTINNSNNNNKKQIVNKHINDYCNSSNDQISNITKKSKSQNTKASNPNKDANTETESIYQNSITDTSQNTVSKRKRDKNPNQQQQQQQQSKHLVDDQQQQPKSQNFQDNANVYQQQISPIVAAAAPVTTPQTYISHTIVSHITNTTTTQDNSLANLHTKLTSLSFSSTRPAVIILNDDTSVQQNITNEFTFGDFDEEELKFYNSSMPCNEFLTNHNQNLGYYQQNQQLLESQNSNNIDINNGINNSSSNLDDSGGHYSFNSVESEVPNSNNNSNSDLILSPNVTENMFNSKKQEQQHLISNNFEKNDSSTDLGYRSQVWDDNATNITNNSVIVENDNKNQKTIVKKNYSEYEKANNNAKDQENIKNIKVSSKSKNSQKNLASNKTQIKLQKSEVNIITKQSVSTSTSPPPTAVSALSSPPSQIATTLQSAHHFYSNSNNNCDFELNCESVKNDNSCILSGNNSANNNVNNWRQRNDTKRENEQTKTQINKVDDNVSSDYKTNICVQPAETISSSSCNLLSPQADSVSSSCSGMESQMRNIKRNINIKYIAPNMDAGMNTVNFEKIINFVGKAWEEICVGREDTEFYDGN